MLRNICRKLSYVPKIWRSVDSQSSLNWTQVWMRTVSTSAECFQANCNAESVGKEKKRKILELEMEISRQEGRKVPDPAFLKEEQWEHLLTLNSRSARIKYYAFLWQIEKKKENKEVKKAKRQEELNKRKLEEKKLAEENPHIIYALSHTCFLLRIYDATINLWNNNKLIRAMQFGEKVVLDCSYDEHMNRREAINAAKQLMICFAENRFHDDPFDIHFCNVNMNSTVMQHLEKHIPTMKEPSFPLNLHQKCFTELFPKDKLVYLTPHCKNDLGSYNPDDIYIIGAMVDKVNNLPLSLAKAKKLGLRMARLPLDRYLQWGAGSGKSLTINQTISILLDIKQTNDWDFALRHVPRRKILETHIKKEEKKVRTRMDKYNFKIDTWANDKDSIRR